MLELQVEHFLNDHQHIKRRFWIKEQKRGKRQEVVVNASIRDALEEYFTAYPEIIGDQNNFIFFISKDNCFLKSIRRGQAWRDYAGWRVNYDQVLLALAELTDAPQAPWSSDRSGKKSF